MIATSPASSTFPPDAAPDDESAAVVVLGAVALDEVDVLDDVALELAGGGVVLVDELDAVSEVLVAVLSDPQAVRPVIAKAAMVIVRVRFMIRPSHGGCANGRAGRGPRWTRNWA
jgi:hypothetical protein